MGLTSADAGAEEHESICEILQVAMQYDQINIAECASFEMLSRRLQLWESMYSNRLRSAVAPSSKSSAIDGEEKTLMLGQPRSVHVSLVCPALEEWIAERLQDRSKILKERRKAKEEADEPEAQGNRRKRGGARGKHQDGQKAGGKAEGDG